MDAAEDAAHNDELTIREAAEVLGRSARTVRRWVKSGKFREARLVQGNYGQEYRIPREAVVSVRAEVSPPGQGYGHALEGLDRLESGIVGVLEKILAETVALRQEQATDRQRFSEVLEHLSRPALPEKTEEGPQDRPGWLARVLSKVGLYKSAEENATSGDNADG